MFKRDFFTCSQREGEGLLAGSCWMTRRYSLVLERDRHLKWRGLDLVEQVLMVLCGVTLAGFSTTVFLDVVTRTLGHRGCGCKKSR
jgi:hypothetical protein